jgi:hypothetical protein
MTRILSLLALSAMLFVCLLASSAQAQVTRTFVSGTGSDSYPCTYTQPCRYFTSAIAALPAGGGEVDVLDPGSYGQITITNSVSIVGRGWTTITSTNTTAAITITGSGTVSIIGVQLDGGGTGEYGIDFTGSGTLHVQDSVIRNFSGTGIYFDPSAPSQVFVSDTLLADNSYGFYVYTPSSSIGVTGALDHVKAENNAFNGFLISVSAPTSLSISNSIAANSLNISTSCGLSASGESASAIATINVSDSTIENNSNGICANFYSTITVRSSTVAGSTNTGVYAISTDATMWVTRSTITGNVTGVSATAGGVVYSFGDNNLFNNPTEGSFTSPTQTYK